MKRFFNIMIIVTLLFSFFAAIVYALASKTVHPTSVSLNKSADTLIINGTEILSATVAPANASDKTVTWTSSNNAIAKVVNGVVTAVSVGTAKVTVKTVNGGKTAACDVTVTNAKLLFTFDDGFKDDITVAADILKAKNFKGTAYIYEAAITGKWASYMNLSDVNNLYKNYGWDIGNHSVHHTLKVNISDPSTLQMLEKDYLDNQKWILSNGWIRGAYNVAYVEGVYNSQLIDYLKGAGIETGRAAWSWKIPANDLYQIPCEDLSLIDLAAAKTQIDKAVNTKSTLVFSLHKINTIGGTYGTKTSDFQQIVDYASQYVLQGKLDVTTISGYYNSVK